MEPKSLTGCCPEFKPELWEGKEIVWNDKIFIKDRVKSFLHIPLNFGGVMKRNMTIIAAAGASVPDNLCLSDENSLWGVDVYIAVDKIIPDAAAEKISGRFIAKVFEGPYSNTGKWIKEMMAYMKSKGKDIKKMYFWYTTCPKCAKVYGKNYVVIFAEI
jgi:hypothetical protein